MFADALRTWADRIREFSKRFPFAHNVALLLSGTVLGQAITVLALPILTRIYAPEAFGLLSVLMMSTMLLSIPACLRLELAIPLAERDQDAIHTLSLALVAGTFFSMGLGVIVALAPETVVEWLGQPGLRPYLWMVPLGVWLLAIYSALQFWSLRMRRFQHVASTQLSRSFFSTVVQFGAGVVGLSPIGLLVGYLVYSGIGIAGFVKHLMQGERHLLEKVQFSGLKAQASHNASFVLYKTPESLLDATVAYFPVLMIGMVGGSAEAGYALLAFRIASIPVALLGGNLSRVFLAEAAHWLREGTLELHSRRLMKRLLWFGFPAVCLLGLTAPIIFPFIFGPEWSRSGEMLRWMSPFILLQFLVAPVSPILIAKQALKSAFFVQLFGFLVVVGSLLSAKYWFPSKAFATYAISSFIYYAAYLAVILYYSSEKQEKLGSNS